MRLSITAIWFLVEFAVGTAAITLCFTSRDIRRSFHRFNFILAAILWLAVAAVALGKDFLVMLSYQGRFWNPEAVALYGVILSLILAWHAQRGEAWQPKTVSSIIWIGALIACAIPSSQTIWVGGKSGPQDWTVLRMATGAFLLGSVHVAMILGHWYLIMRNLSFEHLIRASKMLLSAIIVRIVSTLLAFSDAESGLREQWLGPDLMFVVMRCTWGLLAPLVMAFLTLRLAKTKNNQAATGMLYVCEFCVLAGEAIAAYLRM